MKRSDVDTFEKINGQLTGIYDEMSLLSKKNPSEVANPFKLKFINSLVLSCNSFLSDKYRPFADFEKFDDDDLPQVSDIVFMLSQYLQCFEKLRADNVIVEHGNWLWRIKGETGEKADSNGYVYIRTTKPKRLKE